LSRFFSIIALLVFADLTAQMPSSGVIKSVETPKFSTLEPITLQGGQPQTRTVRNPSMPPQAPSQARQQQSRDEVRAILDEENRTSKPVSYSLPDHQVQPGAVHFRNALVELRDMLEGKSVPSTKKAVFLVENAYMGNATTYQTFCTKVAAEVEWIKKIQSGVELGESQTAWRYALHRYFSDTLLVNGKQHFPYRYDFEDIWGYKDFTKVFVYKLLSAGTGQCHSLPLLYKILADECGLPSYLAFSPAHSYIRYQDERGQWNNFELTNGHLVSDSWILASGYIQSEALRSGIYMDTIGEKGTIAYCIVDMAIAYSVRFGMDGFVAECTDLALKHDPNSLQGWLLRSDYQTVLTQYVMKQVGNVTEAMLRQRYPQAYAQVQKCKGIYAQVDRMGYKPMPKENYQAWLDSGKKP
jgi:hypothetical protein